jgi:hypothetical protein
MKRTNLLAIAWLVIVACSKPADSAKDTGGVATDTQSSAAKSGCPPVTEAEMADAIGAPVTEKQETREGHCLYKTANPVVYADIEARWGNADAEWQGINAGDSTIGAPQDSLTGIGDKAMFGPRDRLYVKQDDVFIAIDAGFDENVRERARKVAKLVVSKL